MIPAFISEYEVATSAIPGLGAGVGLVMPTANTPDIAIEVRGYSPATRRYEAAVLRLIRRLCPTCWVEHGVAAETPHDGVCG